MTVRVRPAEVDVPQDDPFQNDLLDRKPSIEALTDLLGAVEGPCVLALDSEWGGGKTTFLNMWTAHLRNEHYAVVEFNAWETDFSGDPFVALSSRLQLQFEAAPQDKFSETAKRFAKVTKKLALRAAPVAIRILSQGLLDSGSLAQLFTEQVASYAENRLDEFDEVEKSVMDFKEILQEGALHLSEQHSNRPLFIMIDELDRCRPSYAVEFLEIAKHLFSVDKVIFVLALNRPQLECSVKALYGNEFDARGYLYRFIDVDYVLPSPDRERFVLQAISDTELYSLLGDAQQQLQVLPTLIARMLAWSDLDLRRIAQAIRRLALIRAYFGSTSAAIATGVSVALVLRALDAELYQNFRNGDIPDTEVINGLYSYGSLRELEHRDEGYLLEAVISIMWCELSGKSESEPDIFVASPHLSNCVSARNSLEIQARELAFSERVVATMESDRIKLIRASSVIGAARVLLEDPVGIKSSCVIDYIELLPRSEP